jgi:hypothetical protein
MSLTLGKIIMALDALSQSLTNSNLNAFMTTLLGEKTRNAAENSYYAKKGEPMYQEDMDSDSDGVVSYDEFKEYCKENNISSKDIADMIDMRMAYRMSQYAEETFKKANFNDIKTGNLDLIYANDGDGNYDAEIDSNKDLKISYSEYLRYCEQNAKMEAKKSDTKVVEDNKNRFMTVSFGHASNAYNRVQAYAPEGKVESKA